MLQLYTVPPAFAIDTRRDCLKLSCALGLPLFSVDAKHNFVITLIAASLGSNCARIQLTETFAPVAASVPTNGDNQAVDDGLGSRTERIHRSAAIHGPVVVIAAPTTWVNS